VALACDSKPSDGGPLTGEGQEKASRRSGALPAGAELEPRADAEPGSAGRAAERRPGGAAPLHEGYAELCAYGLVCSRW
jgi:hypothetical protein